MSDSRSLQSLQRLVRRESSSLMQYSLGAFPWATSARSEAVNQLHAMIEAERDALADLTRYLYRHKVPPPRSGGYPTDFTSLNFAELGYIAGVLARGQEERLAQLKDDLGLVQDEEGKQLGQALLALKVKHLDALRKLGQPEPAVMP